MAIPALTETELRAALEVLDTFKKAGIKAHRLDPELPTGTVVSFQKIEKEWVLK